MKFSFFYLHTERRVEFLEYFFTSLIPSSKNAVNFLSLTFRTFSSIKSKPIFVEINQTDWDTMENFGWSRTWFFQRNLKFFSIWIQVFKVVKMCFNCSYQEGSWNFRCLWKSVFSYIQQNVKILFQTPSEMPFLDHNYCREVSDWTTKPSVEQHCRI